MAICQIYPTESESDTHNILSVDDVEMRHNARASIDVHSPIRQITNIDPFGSGQPNCTFDVSNVAQVVNWG